MEQAVAQKYKTSQATPVTDRTRYLGYSGGVPNMTIDGKDSNLACNPIDGGVLLTFTPGKAGYLGGWDTMKGGYRRLHIDIMPWEYALTVDRKFHITEDLGYRTLPMLKELPYGYDAATDTVYDEAETYFDIVHPRLTECPFGLNQKIITTEPSVGHAELVWQHCPTCRLAHLKAEGNLARTVNGIGGLDPNILIQLRDLLIEANEAALRFVQQKTELIMGDIHNRRSGQPIGRTGLNVIDRIMLKMQHRKEEAQNDTVGTLVSALQQVGVGQPTQQVAHPLVQTPLSDADRAELEAFRAKKAEQAERMKNAREAKGKKENGNASQIDE